MKQAPADGWLGFILSMLRSIIDNEGPSLNVENIDVD
jgi:hypothetical protein